MNDENLEKGQEIMKKNAYVQKQLTKIEQENKNKEIKLTRAQQNRQIRQDELRKQLAARAGIDQVLIGVYRLENEANEMTAQEISGLGKALDIRMKLLNKYLPDLKSIEVTKEETQETLTIDVHEYKRIREDMLKDDDC